jgi:pimeloyl-ACP methyl ester carboxylesterase
MPSRTLTLPDGRTLGWSEYGLASGRPILGFHGAPACRRLFVPADVPAARLGLRVIAADRPGYGLSSPLPGRTLVGWAADTERLMDHLGIARAPVLAFSGGCPYGVAAAAVLADRISGLALVSPLGEVGNPRARAMMSRMQRAFFLGLPGLPCLLRYGAAAARAAFLVAPETSYAALLQVLSPPDRSVLAALAARRLVIDMTREAIRPGVEGAIADMSIYAQPWEVDPATVACPSVLWQGTADHIVPAEVAFELGRRLGGSVLHRLDGHGHFWIIEHIEEVLAAVARLA